MNNTKARKFEAAHYRDVEKAITTLTRVGIIRWEHNRDGDASAMLRLNLPASVGSPAVLSLNARVMPAKAGKSLQTAVALRTDATDRNATDANDRSTGAAAGQ